MAAEIQQGLLPELTFSGATFDLAAASRPCRTIGGDFFDYLDVSDDRFGFALGDVAGKGPPAALLAVAAQSNFVALAPVTAHPADTMARINVALLRRAIAARFATMFYGALSPEGRLDYCNAGQEPPVVVRANGVTEMLETGGPVVGLLDIASYQQGVLQLLPGDLVVVCSDGVTEARNVADDEYGTDRLIRLLAPRHGRNPQQVLDDLLASVNTFAALAPQADDITALVLRYRGPSAATRPAA
jgi:serine phosphatase RsbU (regulator of sigma subunit)